MRRRDFIIGIAGSAAGWSFASRAQQAEQVRRIGVLMNLAAEDPETMARVAAFLQGLQQFGWVDGRNVQMDTRWAAGDSERARKYAAELVALGPDVILAAATISVAALQQVTRNVPIVFVQITDPVGAGVVASLTRPGGNITGFTLFEYSLSGKWLELLKQIAPGVTRVAVVRDPTLPTGIGEFAAIQSAAPSLRVELAPVDSHDADQIKHAIAAFAQGSDGGLIVTTGAGAAMHRDLIIALAARHRLPAVYPYRYFLASGGLISYGPNTVDAYRRAANYVDRILKGEKPTCRYRHRPSTSCRSTSRPPRRLA